MSDPDFVHRYVPSAIPEAPVLLLLPGTGGDENDWLSLGHELSPHAALLSPRGKVSENGAPRFFRRFAEGVFDEADVRARADELADFVAAAADNYSFPVAHVTAVGYSNGANIAAAVLMLRPETFCEAILFRAMVPLAQLPVSDLRGARVLISAGALDPIIPRANSELLADMLRNAGAEVSLAIQQASHGLVAADLEAAKRWLQG